MLQLEDPTSARERGNEGRSTLCKLEEMCQAVWRRRMTVSIQQREKHHLLFGHFENGSNLLHVSVTVNKKRVKTCVCACVCACVRACVQLNLFLSLKIFEFSVSPVKQCCISLPLTSHVCVCVCVLMHKLLTQSVFMPASRTSPSSMAVPLSCLFFFFCLLTLFWFESPYTTHCQTEYLLQFGLNSHLSQCKEFLKLKQFKEDIKVYHHIKNAYPHHLYLEIRVMHNLTRYHRHYAKSVYLESLSATTTSNFSWFSIKLTDLNPFMCCVMLISWFIQDGLKTLIIYKCVTFWKFL